jgi:DNA-binding response OmpR family regulator
VNLRHRLNLADTVITSGFTYTNLNQDTAGYITGFESYKNDSVAQANPNPEAFRKAQSTRLWSKIETSFDGGHTLSLTAREFALLDYFCRHPNQVFSRNQLLTAVWGYNHEGYEHTVNTHINRLRNKLDNVSVPLNGGQLVQTVWGVGYKLNVEGFVGKALSA